MQRRHEEARADQAVENHHDRGDEQRREREQTQDRRDEDAPDRERHAHQRHAAAARLQHGRDVVQAAHRERDDEDRERQQHQQDAPVVPGRAFEHGLRRVQRPAAAGRAARDEEAREQHDDGEQVDPEAQHVQVREHHVPGAAHERNQVVAEAAEEQRRQQVDDHDHAVHGHELIIVVRRDEAEGVREADLQPHQQRQHERDEPYADRDAAVLDRDDLVVLAPDVLLDPRLGIVHRMVTIGDCYVCHDRSSFRLRAGGLEPPANVCSSLLQRPASAAC